MFLIQCLRSGRKNNVYDPFSSESCDHRIPRIDWKETTEAHVFKAELPGWKTEEVKLKREKGRVLQISGEGSKEQEDNNGKWHLMERSSGNFLRRLTLPENAKMNEVTANMGHGVLTVTVPKERETPEDIEIRTID